MTILLADGDRAVDARFIKASNGQERNRQATEKIPTALERKDRGPCSRDARSSNFRTRAGTAALDSVRVGATAKAQPPHYGSSTTGRNLRRRSLFERIIEADRLFAGAGVGFSYRPLPIFAPGWDIAQQEVRQAALPEVVHDRVGVRDRRPWQQGTRSWFPEPAVLKRRPSPVHRPCHVCVRS
jgi:hypothetical protein